LFVWKESHAFLDGSPRERPHTTDVFTRKGSTQFLRRERRFVVDVMLRSPDIFVGSCGSGGVAIAAFEV